MNKLFRNILFLSSLTLVLAACQEEKVEPGEKDLDGCYGVYFPAQDKAVKLVLDPAEPTSTKITVMRKNSEGEITVPVTVADTSKLFKFAPITFKDGQAETTIDVTFDGIGIGNTYLASLTIEDPAYASKYNSNPISIDVKVLREKWNNLGVGTWVEHGVFNSDTPENVIIHQNDLDKTKYRIYMRFPDPEKEGDEYLSLRLLKSGEVVKSKTKEFKVDKEDLVLFDIFDTGIPYQTGAPNIWFVHPFNFSDPVNLWYYNKVISYQADGVTPAGIQLAPIYYINGLVAIDRSQEDGIITIVFPGAVLTDYTINVSVGETVDGEIPVEFALGADVATAKYAVYEGELSKAAAERHANAIVKGDEESKVVPETGAVSLTLDKSGVYSLVAVSLDDKNEFQKSAVSTFNYVAKGDEEKYPVTVSAGLELTSRYEPEGYTKVNSALFYVYGKNLTEVKASLIPTAKLNPAKLDSLARDPKSVSDSILNLVNTKGWTDLFTELAPVTDYTLIVWASNGYRSKVVTSKITTDGLPRVKKGTGTYTYSLVFVGEGGKPQTDEGLGLYADPNYENTYVIENWGYGVELKFTYDAKSGEIKVPLQTTGAAGEDGEIFIQEAKDYFTPETYKDYDKLPSSSYADGTYSFALAYFDEGGLYNAGVETFKLDGAVESGSISSGNTGRVFKSAGLCAERENVTANFVAREIPANSVVKKIELAKKSAKLVR